MTPLEFKASRAKIGKLMDIGRPIGKGELARILGVSDQTITAYEQGRTAIPGPVILCLWYMARSYPPGGVSARRPKS
jgi:transcriptional regulator with XRE-family HTH domain